MSSGEKTKIRKAFAEINANRNAEVIVAGKQEHLLKPEPPQNLQLSCSDLLESSSFASEDSTIEEPSGGDLSILPNEILEEIFLKLERADQLNLAATCRRMNGCFGSIDVLKTLKYKHSFDKEEIRNVQRRYSWVVFVDLPEPSTDELKDSIESVFQSMGPHVKKLIIENWSASEDFASRVLRHFPNVESFTIRDSDINSSPTYQELAFPKLKRLKIDTNVATHDSWKRILSPIHTLETLLHKVISPGDDSDVENVPQDPQQSTLINDIMMRQPKLNNLQISSGMIFDEMLKASPFKLDTLVLFIATMTKAQVANMMHFVEEQKQLKTVTLNILLDFKSREFNATFAHILRSPTLKNLNIVFYNNQSIQFYRNCKIVNPGVESLYLRAEPDQSFRRFMQSTAKMFPNLKNLGLDIDEKDSKYISSKSFTHLNSLWKLEKLTLDNFRTRLMKTLAFAELNKLHFQPLQQFDKEEFATFLNNNKGITNMDVILHQDDVSTVQLIETTIRHSRRIKNIIICTCQHIIPDDAIANIKALAKEVSSPIQTLKVCNQTVIF